MKRVVFCWPLYSGYMAACWRALAASRAVDFHVLAFRPRESNAAPFDESVMVGVPHRLLDEQERLDGNWIERLVAEQRPDVVVLPGWFHAPYRRLVYARALASCRFVMSMDNPWLGGPRQQFGRFAHRRFLSHISDVIVPGERGYQFARRLGFESSRIHRGLYGVESVRLGAAAAARGTASEDWPKSFLFAGRYHRVKGIDTLLDGYARYRDASTDPWSLRCCGTGPLADAMNGVEGVEDLGFTQPGDMPQRFAEAGCFVLPSRYDPWPLVVVEACMAGLPVICTDACGSAVELLRPHYNGYFFGTGDADGLAGRLADVSRDPSILPAFGARSRELARPYGPEQWVTRWLSVFRG